MKCLILFLISFSVFANYIPKEFVGIEMNLTVFSNSNKCEQHYSSECVKIPSGYNAKVHTLQDELDITKPIYSKSEIETCADQAECEAKNAVKTCIDEDETVYMAEDFSEIYCSKQTGFEKTGKEIIAEDGSKKASYNAEKKAEKDAEKAKKGIAKDINTKLKNGDALTGAERDEALKFIFRNLK